MKYFSNRAASEDNTWWLRPLAWIVSILIWIILLCFVPDPRPLGAPDWTVDLLHTLLGLSERASRTLATISYRAIGFAVLGFLVSLSLKQMTMRLAVPLATLLSPVLAIVCQWVNYGYFPILMQLQLAIVSSILGAWIGLAIRNWMLVGLIAFTLSGLYVWGTSTNVSNDLAQDAKATGEYVLAHADSIPSGDDGFVRVVELAFLFAQDNSHSADPLHPNQAAILALGVILGEERVAAVAKRPISLDRIDEITALRQRVTLRERNDLARHFWVSAALSVLSDQSRSMTVGIGKEMLDSAPGGSGFSFVDLMADRAGTQLTMAATKNAKNARNFQSRIQQGVTIGHFLPDIQGLPEGLSRDEFHVQYGGLGGAETQKIAKEIENRLMGCAAIQTLD